MACAAFVAGVAVCGAAPTVSNVQFTQASSTATSLPQTLVTLTYNLQSAAGPCRVDVLLSENGGATFTTVPLQMLSGDAGDAIAPGASKTIYYRVGEDRPNRLITQAVFRVVAEDGLCATCRLWSDPDTWGGSKPVAGDSVTIPAGTTVLLDEDTPPLDGLTVNGTLEFLPRDLNLTANWIMVHGTFRVGTEAQPYTHRATITLTDTRTTYSVMGMGTRGLLVMGGTLDLHGTPPPVTWTKIGAHAAAGSTALSLIEAVNWQPGDEVAVAPTDYYTANAGASVTQRVAITAASGTNVQLASPLAVARWGALQYVTSSGLSLAPPPQPYVPPVTSCPLVLDERAEVGHLTRNIVIQAPNDTAWATQGFGVQTMVMGTGSMARVDGVEIRRGGQRNQLGHYPWHWHMLSYNPPATLADATGHYFRNSVINSSTNRGIVIHGTNGVQVQSNVVYDVQGHGIFTEDAVERRNIIDRNLVLRVRNTTGANRLKLHEYEAPENPESGSSGFWLSNPDNVITNNVAADCNAFGFWMAFPANPWGLSQGVLDVRPNRVPFGTFRGNIAHSNRFEGVMNDLPEVSNEGLVSNNGLLQYASTSDGQPVVWPQANLRRFELSDLVLWKNGKGGLWDRARRPDNLRIVAADNCQRFFAGSGDDGLIEGCLVIGTSLNNPTPRPTWSGDPTPSAFATYHSSFDIRRNVAINFPAVANTRSGVFATDDYYLRPVERGQERNVGNVIINSHPGVKLQAAFSYFKLAGAMLDPFGVWGPAGQWVVYDDPFLTYGETTTPLLGGAIAGAVSCPGNYFGFNDFVLNNANQPYEDFMGITATRLDAALQPVATWTVTQAQPWWQLAHMRHVPAHAAGSYRLEFPNDPAPSSFRMTVDHMLHTTQTLLVGIEFNGATTPTVTLRPETSTPPMIRTYTAVGSLQAVRDSAGETFWQDTANNILWVKLQGGRWQWWDPNGIEALPSVYDLQYNSMVLMIN